MSDLTSILAKARYLLLDFDGPVCAVYAGIPPRTSHHGSGTSSPTRASASRRRTANRRPARCVQGNTRHQPPILGRRPESAHQPGSRSRRQRQADSGAAELIKEAHHTGRAVAIVSNNSGAAIRAYLQLNDLSADVALIVGRDDPDPDLMKPSPYLVRAAVGILDTEGKHCVFIGDFASDVLAGLLAGVPPEPIESAPRRLAPMACSHSRLNPAESRWFWQLSGMR